MRWSPLLLLSISGCSLLVQFDPESQLCDSAGACLSGYVCQAVEGMDAGVCKAGDAGTIIVDAGAPDASTTPETACGDGLDNDGDGQKDCNDSDCQRQPCNDGNSCSTGDTCVGTTCVGAICNSPPNACQSPTGTCDAGRCFYPVIQDGFPCGAAPVARCCAGTCIDTSLNSANCGGCGLTCGNGETCRPFNPVTCTPVTDGGTTPQAVSGRCTCALGANCPGGAGGQVCTLSTCRPTTATPPQCAAMQALGGNDGGTCGAYCRYP